MNTPNRSSTMLSKLYEPGLKSCQAYLAKTDRSYDTIINFARIECMYSIISIKISLVHYFTLVGLYTNIGYYFGTKPELLIITLRATKSIMMIRFLPSVRFLLKIKNRRYRAIDEF